MEFVNLDILQKLRLLPPVCPVAPTLTWIPRGLANRVGRIGTTLYWDLLKAIDANGEVVNIQVKLVDVHLLLGSQLVE